MQTSISAFVGTLADFLSQIDSSTQSLVESVQRRPIPLDSAASSFLHRLDTRVSAAASDLERLESMALGTVSFAELLGHCHEVYKKNASLILELEERLKSSGYHPEVEVDDGGDLGLDMVLVSSTGLECVGCAVDSALGSTTTSNVIEVDDIFDESMSLQNLGLSDACLATLAYEDKDDLTSAKQFSRTTMPSYANGNSLEKRSCHPSIDVQRVQEKYSPLVGAVCIKGNFSHPDLSKDASVREIINLSKNDYEMIPSYMKSLASWEDTSEAVSKINSELLKMQNRGKKHRSFDADDLENFGLGRKGRCYLLLLLKMNKLVVETEGGSVVYRVVSDS